MTILANAAA